MITLKNIHKVSDLYVKNVESVLNRWNEPGTLGSPLGLFYLFLNKRFLEDAIRSWTNNRLETL